jgi:hypothetical protein
MKRRRRGSGGRLFKRKKRKDILERQGIKPDSRAAYYPTWHMGFYVRGCDEEQHESTFTTDYNEAKQKLREKVGEIARGRVTKHTLQRHTLQDALAKLAEKRELPTGHVEAWGHAIGSVRLDRVHSVYEQADDVLTKWKQDGVSWPDRPDSRVRPITGGTANRYLATLGQALKLAKKHWHLPLDVSLPYDHAAERVRKVYWEPADFFAMLAHVKEGDERDVMELAYRNGVRRGQWRNLEKRNVLLDADKKPYAILWDAEQTKNGEPHRLVLVGRSRDLIIRAWDNRRPDCPHLFHGRGCPRPKFDKQGRREPCLGTLRSARERACRKAGFTVKVQQEDGSWVDTGKPLYRFHDTRHAGVTHSTSLGIADPVGMSISGHKDVKSYSGYAHPQDEAQRVALERINAHIDEHAGDAVRVTPLPTRKKKAS